MSASAATTRAIAYLRRKVGRDRERRVVEEADRAKPDLRLGQEPLGGEGADPPAADHQGRAERVAGAPSTRLLPQDGPAAGHDERSGDQQLTNGLSGHV